MAPRDIVEIFVTERSIETKVKISDSWQDIPPPS